MKNVFFLSFLCFALLVSGGSPVLASRVKLVGLEEMTERAERIFAGRCSGVTIERDEQLGHEITVVTFEVARAVKGGPGSEVTLRMLGGVPGLPSFTVGEEVILFLGGESTLGLSSPVGLGQGKFTVVEDKLGRKIARNGLGKLGPIAADSLLEAVERLAVRP